MAKMKRAAIVDKRSNMALVLIAVLALLVADPFGVFRGNFSQDSYSEIRDEISKTPNAKVLLVGSWNDFYSLEYNNYWRTEISREFVERNYDEVLDAASLGNDFFNRYLLSRSITHILVPKTTADQGAIFHKFSNRGSIEINLRNTLFKRVSSSKGPYPSVLFEVRKSLSQPIKLGNFSYELSWENADWRFYTKQTKITEVGLYKLSYLPLYEWGPDVSWYFDDRPERSDILELRFDSSNEALNRVNLELTLVSAYGSNAPPHGVWVSTENYSETKTLSPNKPGVFEISLNTGQSVKIRNISPCRLPKTFEPTDLTNRKMCFGVAKVIISP